MSAPAGPESLRLGPHVSIPLDEIVVRYDTSGGAGGQHANRAHTRVELAFDPASSPSLTEAQRRRIVAKLGPIVTVTAADTRSQSRNRELAYQRLADRLIEALRVDPPRRATRPSKSSTRRRLDGKRQAGMRKQLRRRPAADD